MILQEMVLDCRVACGGIQPLGKQADSRVPEFPQGIQRQGHALGPVPHEHVDIEAFELATLDDHVPGLRLEHRDDFDRENRTPWLEHAHVVAPVAEHVPEFDCIAVADGYGPAACLQEFGLQGMGDLVAPQAWRRMAHDQDPRRTRASMDARPGDVPSRHEGSAPDEALYQP
ncbi:MAG: hypothetical protein F4Z55_11635, partial [Boseongicola sp. SB0667_bin_21]|nr:hypothetical protein [Boseongicola sp. SB0667_bin_21]